MTTHIDLKQIEEKTRTSYFEDGFWDIGVGFMVVAFNLWFPTWTSSRGEALWYFAFLFFLMASMLTPMIARRYITYPRTGQAKLR